MASIKRTGITDKGKDLITREIAGITELTFTKISASSNKLADTVNLETLINIDGVKQTVNVSKVEKIGASQIKVTATFNNSGLMSGYSMETLGIYAKDTAETEVLFAITVANVADFMPATNGINLSTVTVELIFNLSNTDNVSLSIDTSALVTTGMFNSFKSEVNKDYVKYTDLAEENKAGIITYAKVKEIAPKPDLSPYQLKTNFWKYPDSKLKVVGTNSDNGHSYVGAEIQMFNSSGQYQGSFHTNGGKAYYKVPNRNGGNWCEFMDNHDMVARDIRMNGIDSNIQHAHNRITDTWNKAVDAWNRTENIYWIVNNDTVRDIRLVGFIELGRHNYGAVERAGYVVTGIKTQPSNQDFWVQMRALQERRGVGGQNWYNVPFG